MVKDKEREKLIIQLREKGLSYGSISKMLKISRARVHQIYSGYRTPENLNWREKRIYESILRRDNYQCQWKKYCKDKIIARKELCVHHIDFDDRNNNPSNLITVCEYCHLGFHSKNHIDKDIEEKLCKKHRVIIKCIRCSKEKEVRYSLRNQKYCSDQCRNDATRKYANKKERERAKNSRHKEYRKKYYKKYWQIHKRSKKI